MSCAPCSSTSTVVVLTAAVAQRVSGADAYLADLAAVELGRGLPLGLDPTKYAQTDRFADQARRAMAAHREAFARTADPPYARQVGRDVAERMARTEPLQPAGLPWSRA